jgi:glucose/arabinose dehydrogenase
MTFDQPKTAAMRKFLAREKGRVVGLSIEPDGVFIYTNSHEWHDGSLAGTFRGDSETAAIARFRERVTKASDEA